MANMTPNKCPMPVQDPDVRNKNFEEVALGYTMEMAMGEAERCLNCKNSPCVSGCPVGVRIPDFISLIKAGDIEGAYAKIKETNALPAVCGRVCPQENQCESKCVRGIKAEPVGIGRLERFAADYCFGKGDAGEKAAPNGKKVAVVGAGPAGLTCAGALAKLGYSVTIFEASHVAGGVLVYGIPQFRLPKEIVKAEIDALEASGVEIKLNAVVGRAVTIDELLGGEYSAVFVGTGAGLPKFMGIEGEALNGVYSANEYLTRINLMKAYKDEYDTPIKRGGSVAVVGGGNVAMDAARCALRMGSDHVYIIYRRSEAEMPARVEEVHHAKEEGVDFKMLTNPVRVLDDGNGCVSGIECVEMELGEPDESGRRSPVEKQGSNFVIPVNAVIMALGTTPNPLIRSTTAGLETNRRGCIIVNEETMESSKPNVYAGGDAVTGAATVILAMGAGKKAAAAIHEKLSK